MVCAHGQWEASWSKGCENTGRPSKTTGYWTIGLCPKSGHRGYGMDTARPNATQDKAVVAHRAQEAPAVGGTKVQPRPTGPELVPTASHLPSVSSEDQVSRCQVSQNQRRTIHAVPIIHEQGRV